MAKQNGSRKIGHNKTRSQSMKRYNLEMRWERNKKRRIASAERQRDRDAKKAVACEAKRAQGALRRFEKYLPARMRDAADNELMADHLRRTHRKVLSAFDAIKHMLPRAA